LEYHVSSQETDLGSPLIAATFVFYSGVLIMKPLSHSKTVNSSFYSKQPFTTVNGNRALLKEVMMVLFTNKCI